MKKNILIVAFLFVCMGLEAQRNREPPIPYRPVWEMSDVVRSEFFAEHYWEGFRFNDTMQIHHTDEYGRRWLPTFFSMYLRFIQFADLPIIQKSLVDVIKKSDTNERMYRFFIETFDFYLNDALSELREEQWIVPVWQQMLKSRWCTAADSGKIRFFLRMAAKNPVGSTATDLDFVSIQGQKGKLSEIDAELLLVYFYIPGCPQCVMTLEWIQEDSAYQEIHKAGILRGFAFYPEKDMNLFRTYSSSIPNTWLNARDPDGMSQLEEEEKYQMRGAPTIYLLDKNKKVILKDARMDLLFREFEKARDKYLKN
jgi:hypothetical protein